MSRQRDQAVRTVAQAYGSAVVELGNLREWSFSGMAFSSQSRRVSCSNSYLGVPMPIPKRADTASALDNASCKVKEAAPGKLPSATNAKDRRWPLRLTVITQSCSQFWRSKHTTDLF